MGIHLKMDDSTGDTKISPFASRPPPSSDGDTNPTERKNRKRKADSIGRVAQQQQPTTTKNGTATFTTDDGATINTKSGRGSLVGWTTCPLCGRHSKKQFALGRGIAAHLHAVHTPWKPGKMERKKRQRVQARRRAEQQRQGKDNNDNGGITDDGPKTLETWEPNQQEIDAWDEQVLLIITDLEVVVEDTTNDAGGISSNDKHDTKAAGFDRNGVPTLSYRSSLPPFIQAAADGDLAKLQELYAQAQAQSNEAPDERESAVVLDLLNTRDRHLSTAEHWAAGGGHIECLRFLLERRQEVLKSRPPPETNVSSESSVTAKRTRRRDGKTCLHYSARNGHLPCVEFLLEKQGHTIDDTAIDEISGDGTTPFHLACFGGHFQVAKYLMDKGANVQATNEWGCSGAHWVGMTSSTDPSDVRKLCLLLKQAGVSFSKQQKQGHSALHKAAQKKNRLVIEWMAESSDHGGAGLSIEEKEQAARPDVGGHTPSEIWRCVGGGEAFAKQMDQEWGSSPTG